MNQCKKFNELSEFIRLGAQHPRIVKSVKDGTFPTEHLALAAAMIEPIADPKTNNRWFKAIALASKATQYLPNNWMGQIYTPVTAIPQLYMKTIGALSSFYADTYKYPDWALLGQLLLDGHAQLITPEPRAQSMVSILAKALDPDTKGPLALMELSTSVWSTPHNAPQAMPIEPSKDPILAMKALLDQIGPVSQWYLQPKGDSGPRILRILDATSDMAERFARLIHNYLDQTYVPEAGMPFIQSLPEKKAKKLLKHELENLCQIISFFIHNEENSSNSALSPMKGGKRAACKKNKKYK
jgi:hypothetical protein